MLGISPVYRYIAPLKRKNKGNADLRSLRMPLAAISLWSMGQARCRLYGLWGRLMYRFWQLEKWRISCNLIPLLNWALISSA